MKRTLCLLAALLICLAAACPVLADNAEPVSVEIISPESISASPIHYDDIVIRVTNNTSETMSGLRCFLTVLDVGRSQTLPVDEFGTDAFQSRTIDSLAAGESVDVTIPVRIMYVGDFRFTATVADCGTNALYTGPAISIDMTAVSSMNKTLVIAAAIGMPLVLATAALVLTRGRKQAIILNKY